MSLLTPVWILYVLLSVCVGVGGGGGGVYMRTPTAKVLRPMLSLSPTHRVVQTLSSLYSLALYFSRSLSPRQTHTLTHSTSTFVRTWIGIMYFSASSPNPNVPTKTKLSSKLSCLPRNSLSTHTVSPSVKQQKWNWMKGSALDSKMDSVPVLLHLKKTLKSKKCKLKPGTRTLLNWTFL